MVGSEEKPLAGKVAVVTGGSRGIGFAVAEALVTRGARVALLARSPDALADAASKLGDAALPVETDVSLSGSVRAAFDVVQQEFGRLDLLVNNAAVGRVNKVEDASDEELALQVETNLMGVLYCTRAAIPALRENSGHIINVSSDSAADPFPLLSVYAATKGGVELFTRALRNELQPEGIRVTLLRPGPTITTFGNAWDPAAAAAAGALWVDTGHISADAVLTPDEIGEAVAYIVTRPDGATVEFFEVRPTRKA